MGEVVIDNAKKNTSKGWAKDFLDYCETDGWLKAILWTVLGRSFFIALILETVCFLLSARDGVCYAAYVASLGWTLKLKNEVEAREYKQEHESKEEHEA